MPALIHIFCSEIIDSAQLPAWRSEYNRPKILLDCIGKMNESSEGAAKAQQERNCSGDCSRDAEGRSRRRKKSKSRAEAHANTEKAARIHVHVHTNTYTWTREKESLQRRSRVRDYTHSRLLSREIGVISRARRRSERERRSKAHRSR